MNRKNLIATSTLAFIVSVGPVASANELDRAGDRACAKVQADMNLIADSMLTRCLFVSKPPRTLLLITESALFDDPVRSKAFVAMLTASAGSAIRANPQARVAEVAFGDLRLLRNREYWVIPASQAVRLQAEVGSDRMGARAYMDEVWRIGQRRKLPETAKP